MHLDPLAGESSRQWLEWSGWRRSCFPSSVHSWWYTSSHSIHANAFPYNRSSQIVKAVWYEHNMITWTMLCLSLMQRTLIVPMIFCPTILRDVLPFKTQLMSMITSQKRQKRTNSSISCLQLSQFNISHAKGFGNSVKGLFWWTRCLDGCPSSAQ